MSKIDNAVNCFQHGFNCSQAVFSTYCEQLGLDAETAFKVSCPFGAGMGRMACTCGAVTGAFMLIGLKHGKYKEEDNVARELSYRLVREFSEKFKAVNGSLLCRELLNCDLSTPEGVAYNKENGITAKLCPEFVRDSAQIIEELLGLK